MSKKDYYQILGLAKTATEDEIKQAYRKLAMKFHPDRNKEKGAEEKFKEVKDAYEHLSDPNKKTHYDQNGFNEGPFSHHTNTGTSSNPFDHSEFEEMFSHFFSKNQGKGFNENVFNQQNQPQTLVMTISLADAYIGKSLRIDSTTTLVIPKGIRSGTKLYANGKMYRVDIQPHFKYKRSNDDLLIDVEITAIEAMLGTSAMFNHLDGTQLQFTIPSGIQPGQIVRLANKGMKNPELDKYGDILVRITVSIPKSLTEEQKAVLKTVGYRATINI